MGRVLLCGLLLAIASSSGALAEGSHGDSPARVRSVAVPTEHPLAESSPEAELDKAKIQGSTPEHRLNKAAEEMLESLAELHRAAGSMKGPSKKDD